MTPARAEAARNIKNATEHDIKEWVSGRDGEPEKLHKKIRFSLNMPDFIRRLFACSPFRPFTSTPSRPSLPVSPSLPFPVSSFPIFSPSRLHILVSSLPISSFLGPISFILPFLTSLLLILSYPKFGFGFIAWIAFAPLALSLLRSKTSSQCVKISYFTGLAFNIGLLYWIYYTCRAGGLPVLLSIAAWISLSALISIEWALFGWIAGKIKNNKFFLPLSAALAWTAVEWLKLFVAQHAVWFPWFLLGYTQWKYPAIIQIVSITGTLGLSFMIAFTGFSIASALSAEGFKERLRIMTPSVILFTANLFFGFFTLNFPPVPRSPLLVPRSSFLVPRSSFPKSIICAVLQPNIDLYKKWDAKYEEEIEERLGALLKKAETGKPMLVIWPESALPGWIEEKKYSQWLNRLARDMNAWHLVGSISETDGKHVSAFLINPEGKTVGRYDKQQLVPFGEYVPFRNVLNKWISVIGMLGEFQPGSANQPLLELKNNPKAHVSLSRLSGESRNPGISTTLDPGFPYFAKATKDKRRGDEPTAILEPKNKKAGISICYESIFPYILRTSSKQNADFLINITNDGWYLDTAAPYQHFLVNIFRAVENRKPLIRAGNTGISALISPYGQVLSQTRLNTESLLEFDFTPANGQPSPYTRYGDIFGLICAILTLIMFFGTSGFAVRK